MVPLPHIDWSFSALVAFIIAQRIERSYRQSRSENLGYFFKSFILLGAFFCLVSFPGLILQDPSLVQIAYIFSWALILPIPFLLLKIVFDIWNLSKWKNLCVPAGFFLSSFSLLLNILYFKPAKTQIVQHSYWYWSEGTPIWFQMAGGFIVGSLTLLAGLFFLIQGLRSQKKAIRARSFLIGGGIIVLFLGCIASYMLFLLSSMAVIISGLLSLAGMIVVYLGIRYKTE